MIALLPLALSLLSSPSAFAQDAPQPSAQQAAPIAQKGMAKADPRLVRLDQSLAKVQDDKKNGLLDEKHYQSFLTKFRADLAAATAQLKPTPANTALHARILSRLGDSEQAMSALGPALKQDPSNPALRIALGQVRYDQKDYPAALAEANAVLTLDPTNKEALALKHFSEGRVGPTGGTSSAPDAAWGISDGAVAVPPDFGAARKDASPRVMAMITEATTARHKGDLETPWKLAQQAMRDEPTSPAAQDFYAAAKADREKVNEVIGYVERGRAAAHAGNDREALAWLQKAAQTVPSPKILEVLKVVQARVDKSGATRTTTVTPLEPPTDSGPNPWPLVPIGAAGGAAGLAGWAVLRRRSDEPKVRGPMMAFAMAGVGATGSMLAGGVYMKAAYHGATDVGMYHTDQAPLLQGAPKVADSPQKPTDCVEQLKKFYPQQQDAQQKRQGALSGLQPILDKYGLSYEKFQSVFPKLMASYVATCDADPAACQLMANKADWTAVQASYGQVQALDQKLQLASSALAAQMDACKAPGNDVRGKKKENDVVASKSAESEPGGREGQHGGSASQGIAATAAKSEIEGATSSLRKPSATNPELQRAIDKLFQPGDTRPGGTAGAVRWEFSSGQPTQGRFHLQAGKERISWLNRIIREQDLNAVDRATAEAMRDDLQQAVDLYKTKPTP